MHGLAVGEENDPKKPAVCFRNGAPSSNPPIGLRHLAYGRVDCPLNPLGQNRRAIGPPTDRLEVHRRLHGRTLAERRRRSKWCRRLRRCDARRPSPSFSAAFGAGDDPRGRWIAPVHTRRILPVSSSCIMPCLINCVLASLASSAAISASISERIVVMATCSRKDGKDIQAAEKNDGLRLG